MKLSTAELLERIRDSELVRPEKLAQWMEAAKQEDPKITSRRVALRLVNTQLLTRFQVARILKGEQRGLKLGNIVLEELIGSGGMGTVYRARHRRMNRQVAVKVLHQTTARNDHMLQRFQREAYAAARLTHPNIVTAYDADDQNGQLFLVMEYVEGEDLASIVERDGPMNVAKAVNCVVQAAQGLHYAHSQGVVHRDVKPSNLLLDRAGVLKILDMGLARMEERPSDSLGSGGLTGEHELLGTVDYMSPEQADDSKQVNERADVYSLGCTLFYLLTGRSPFYRPTILKTLLAHRTAPIPRAKEIAPQIPDDLDTLLVEMLAKDPQDRIGNMGEVIKRLSRFDDDTDFHLAESVEFSILPDDDSETKTFELSELDPKRSSGENASRLGSTAPLVLPPIEPTPSRDTSREAGGQQERKSEYPTMEAAQVLGVAVGIDLGTTNSVIAHLDPGGRPVTLHNAEGEQLTPSVLLLDDEVVVGREAVKAMSTDMASIAENVKRELGRREFPKRMRGQSFPPEVLLSWILKKLRVDAEAQIGPFSTAVITVPAYFDEVRRYATMLAGQLAGIEVLDIINEPTAAALAFGYEEQQRQAASGDSTSVAQNYLVYDLGGGTFDVTVMRLKGTDYQTLATDGDVRLGGRDWDERLIEFVAGEFESRFGIDVRKNLNGWGRLVRECEEVKRSLTTRKKATLNFELNGSNLQLEVTRKHFEELTLDLLSRTEFTTRDTLEQSGLRWEDLDQVLMVGGSTRMPAVAQMLSRLSGKTPSRSLSPDESVAKGAALRAGSLLALRAGGPVPFTIRNVNSHSLGVVGRDPKTRKRQVAVLIPRNTPLPARVSKVFRTQKTGQQSILVQIVEGESDQPDFCSLVGRCTLHGLPDNLPAKTPIKVTFAYDERGRLNVELEVERTKLTQVIDRPNSLSEPELERWQKWLLTGQLEVDDAQLIDFDDD